MGKNLCHNHLRVMMNKAIYSKTGPNVVRYPRGTEKKLFSKIDSSVDYNILGNKNAKKAIVTFGRLFNTTRYGSKIADK